MILRYYRKAGQGFENCYYVETASPLSVRHASVLQWLLSETFEPDKFAADSFIEGGVRSSRSARD